MVRRISQIVIVAASLAMGACLATSTWAAPIQPVDIGQSVAPAMTQASFWGLPYPYGYADRGNRCWKRVRVQTEMGWRWQRVWVCG